MRIGGHLDGNRILLGIFVVVSAWALITAFGFPSRDALFPILASSLVLLGSLLLLAIDLAPSSVSDTIETTEDLFNTEDLREERETDQLDTRKRHVLIGLIGAYLLIGYLIGLLWATPIFVLAYTRFTRQELPVVAGLTLLSFLIAYGFMDVLHLSIDRGVLIGVIAHGL
ncbi:MAG: tripartite tricarboxylate transporter TctB family protein [Haloferacaceae archaeon]